MEEEAFSKAYIQFVDFIIRSDGLVLFENFVRLELSLYCISYELSHRDKLGYYLEMGDKKMEAKFVAYANDNIKFKEGYEPISKMETVAGLFLWEWKHRYGEEVFDQKHSRFVEKSQGELVKLIKSIDIRNMKSLDKVRLYCRFASNFFVKLPGEEHPLGIFPMITYYDEVWIQLFATANQMIGYWKAKIERIKSSMTGGKATAMAKEKRIEKLFNFLKESGLQAKDGIKVDRHEWETFFTRDLEIYTDRTKREYKRIIEKRLKEESGKDLKIRI